MALPLQLIVACKYRIGILRHDGFELFDDAEIGLHLFQGPQAAGLGGQTYEQNQKENRKSSFLYIGAC